MWDEMVENGDLVIAGERSRGGDIGDDASYWLESKYGAFRRRVPLPSWVDEDTITTSCVDDVLEIVLPPNGIARERRHHSMEERSDR
jgi:HSP20 family molecular chaperone IbpA